MPEALFVVFLSDSKGAKMFFYWIPNVQKCVNLCKSCRSREELSNQCLLFTCKIWRRYTREGASESLSKISKLVTIILNYPEVRKIEKT